MPHMTIQKTDYSETQTNITKIKFNEFSYKGLKIFQHPSPPVIHSDQASTLEAEINRNQVTSYGSNTL